MSGAPVLRDLSPADAAETAALAKASAEKPWTEGMISGELARKDVLCRGAAADGRLAGFLFVRYFPDEWQVMELAVAPAARRRGLARALMSDALSRAAARGCPAVTLEVRAGNGPALGLYASLGFTVVGRRPRYYEGREDAVLMKKLL